MKTPTLGKSFYSLFVCLWLAWSAAAQAAAPTITGVWPGTTTPRTPVFVFGSDFNTVPGGSKVSYGGVPAPMVQVIDSTLLIFYIPSGGTSQQVCVSTLGGSSCFTPPVCSGLCVTGLWPGQGSVGSYVFIFGAGFDPAPGKTQVSLAGTPVPLAHVANASLIIFVVPRGAASGVVRVTTPMGSATSAMSFLITPSVAFVTAASRGSETLSLSDISVTLDRVSDKTVTVNWTVTGGTASGVAYLDYFMMPVGSDSGTLTFAPGTVLQTIQIVNRRDDLVEGNETVTLSLSSPSNATLDTAKAAHTYTILDSPPRGVAGDFWADVVLGQRDHTESTTNTVVPNHAFNVTGVVVDRSPGSGANGRVHVWDGGNNRILGFNLDTCYAAPGQACMPTLVIGQPLGTDYGSCNQDASMSYYPYLGPASASTLCGTAAWYISPKEGARRSSMAVDQATGDLYVPDYENNRVLVFEKPFDNSPGRSPTIADHVIGQDDFSGVYCNKVAYKRNGNLDGETDPSTPIAAPSASSLCALSVITQRGAQSLVQSLAQGFGVSLDSSGNLWVADGGNNRVLRFPKDPLTRTIRKSADLVLGQPDFTSRVNGVGLDQMHAPTSLAFGPNGTLYVTDGSTQEQNGKVYDNSRVLVFAPPFTSGMVGTRFAGNTVFNRPYVKAVSDIAGHPLLSGLWISSWVPDAPNVNQHFKVEQYTFDGTWVRTLPMWKNVSNAFEGSVDVDNAGNILVPGARDISDVIIYQKAASYSDTPATLLPPSFLYNIASDSRLFTAGGIASARNQLYVADHHRIMIWNNLDQLTNGKAADSFIGQVDFASYDRLFNGDSPYSQMKVDSKLRLWVASRNRIFVFQTPLYTWSKPIKVIQGPLGVLNSAEKILRLSDSGREFGLVPMVTASNEDFLWIAQPFDHRVLRIRDPLGLTPKVDVVLGQVDLSGQCCNGMPKDPTMNICPAGDSPYYSHNLAPPMGGPGTLDKLCHPYNLSMDRNRDLYVSDHMSEGAGNLRMLMFKTSDTVKFPTNNSNVIYAPLAYKEFPRPQATYEAAFNTFVAADSINRMVVGYDSYRGNSPYAGIYENPGLPSVTTPTCTRPSGETDCYLNDHMTAAFAATFDMLGNLYVADGNRTKVFIYKQPFLSIPGSQAPVHPAMTTVTSHIAASSDDAYTCGSYTTTSDSFTTVGQCPGGSASAIAGLRFNGINIPSTATIDHAVIIYKPYSPTLFNTYGEPLKVKISGVRNVNPLPFLTTVPLTSLPLINDAATGTPVTVSLDDSDNGPWKAEHWRATPNLAGIVQNVIGQSGWASGNSMAFLISNDGTLLISKDGTSNERSFIAYDSSPNPKYAPILYIQYH